MNTLQQTLAAFSHKATPVIAGGTDVYPALADAEPPARFIDVHSFEELRGIHRRPDGSMDIGAGVTWSDLRRAELPSAFDGLRAAAKEVGSIQIQNRATLVGNLCTASPAADGMPPLLALNADVVLSSARGQRVLPLSEFVTGVRTTACQDDELVVSIRVPRVDNATLAGFSKLGSRCYLVISIAMVAVCLTPDADGRITDAAVSVGACSPVARRLPMLEERLLGCAITDAGALSRCVDAACLSVLAPIDDVRASASYRLTAAQEMISRLLVSTAHRASLPST